MVSKNSFIDILIVDDEEDICELVSEILSDDGYSTRTAIGYSDAVLAIENKLPQLVILDVWLGDGDRDGIRLLQQIKSQNQYLPVIMMSGHGTISTAVSAIQKGAYDFIEKPFEPSRLLVSVSKALQSAILQRENEFLKIKAKNTDHVLGVSQNVSDINSFIDRVSALNGRCIIVGNKFSDKEDIARKIHNSSPRAHSQFCMINCAQCEPRYLELELFGSEIVSGEQINIMHGLFEKTNGGTLFIDNIDAMPHDVQSKLLNCLISNSFTRIGGKTSSSLPLNSRIICGVSETLNNAVNNGRFNKDLYYLINVNSINVFPLNKRVVDIPFLIRYYLDNLSEIYSSPKITISPEIVTILQNHDWSEDIVELRGVTDVVFSRVMAHKDKSTTILKEDLPESITGINQPAKEPEVPCDSTVFDLGIKDAKECFEREYFKVQLKKFAGNVHRTSQVIGMDRSALYRRLKYLKIK